MMNEKDMSDKCFSQLTFALKKASTSDQNVDKMCNNQKLVPVANPFSSLNELRSLDFVSFTMYSQYM